jgi:hypothetical protein
VGYTEAGNFIRHYTGQRFTLLGLFATVNTALFAVGIGYVVPGGTAGALTVARLLGFAVSLVLTLYEEDVTKFIIAYQEIKDGLAVQLGLPTMHPEQRPLRRIQGLVAVQWFCRAATLSWLVLLVLSLLPIVSDFVTRILSMVH